MLDLMKLDDFVMSPWRTNRYKEPMFRTTSWKENQFYQKVDEEGNLVVAVPMAGIEKNKAKIIAENGLVTVEYEGQILDEKVSGTVSFSVQKKFNLDHADAKMGEGVLYITIPPNETYNKMIEIK